MTSKYFSKSARIFSAAALVAGLTVFPAKKAAVQTPLQSKSVLEQMIEKHYNPHPGNIWEISPRKDIQRTPLKISHLKNKPLKEVARYFRKHLGLKYGNLNPNERVHNLGIIQKMYDDEFNFFVDKIGFDNVRSLLMTRDECGKYPLGEERAEKLRGLVGKINYSVTGKNVNAWQVLAHISVESGGENFLNCEGGGGVFHILYAYGNFNLLNVEKNISRGVEMLEFLTNQFNNPKTAAIAFNTSNGKLVRAKKEFERYMKRSPNHLELMAYLKIINPGSHKKSERYEKLLKGHEIFLEKYFSYDKENNRITIIPQIKYQVRI